MDFESIEYANFSTRAGGRRVAEVRSREEVATVLELIRSGRNDCQIARETGIPRSTIRQWRQGQTPDFDRVRASPFTGRACAVCSGDPMQLPQVPYTYLLGLYLGDGCLSTCPREVYRLRIACTERTGRAQARTPDRAGRLAAGPGRPGPAAADQGVAPLGRVPGAELGEWHSLSPVPLQQRVRGHPGDLRAGLRPAGIEWRANNRWSLSVARRGSVALLDEFVGPKR
jgi:hypothetical protein